jgi:hypothetical protein
LATFTERLEDCDPPAAAEASMVLLVTFRLKKMPYLDDLLAALLLSRG